MSSQSCGLILHVLDKKGKLDSMPTLLETSLTAWPATGSERAAYQLDLVGKLRAGLAHVHHGLIVAGHVFAFALVPATELCPHPRSILWRDALQHETSN